MRTTEERNTLKDAAGPMSRKPHALTDDELEQVTGGLRDEWVYEENGIFSYLFCEKCGMRFSIDDFQEAIEHEHNCICGK